MLPLTGSSARSAALEVRNPVVLANGQVRFEISPEDGRYRITDLRTGAIWESNPYRARFGQVVLMIGGQKHPCDLSACSIKSSGTWLEATFHPVAGRPDEWLRVKVEATDEGLELSYEAASMLEVERIRLLDEAMSVTAQEKGCALVPARLGLLVPADSGLAFTQGFDTYAYEGCHMMMLGIVKNGATALITWDDPYVSAELHSVLPGAAQTVTTQTLSCSLSLRKSARSCTIRFPGKGDHVTIAKAYREVARRDGWLVGWDQKLQGHPERARLFGAINFKLWSTLSRQMNEESTQEESLHLSWTFDESAQVAEHLKKDLKLEKVLFTLGGWIHRGYDNQHPDILPAAPECGGDEALANCAKRVMGLGYLFCLHDNYQDIYRDAPSWDQSLLQKNADGTPAKGGHWAGGRAYLTCSQRAVDLAKRPQNLEAVKKLTGADAYFIDTTYAVGLQECFDPQHPLTRRGDMYWKQVLSDYAREVFGIFGSECGREWAVPHSDFFEGLTGVSGGYYADAGLMPKLGATAVPLFEIVYRDCIQMYGKYGYDIEASAPYVLHHISIGRPLNYHNVPAHLYWLRPQESKSLAVQPLVAEVTPTGPRQFAISYRWMVQKPIAGDWSAFVHFTDPSGQIKFQGDYEPQPATSSWQAGQMVQGPFTVTVPEGVSGTFDIRTGLFRKERNVRAILRGPCDGERRCLLGQIKVTDAGIEFIKPAETAATAPTGDPALFVRGDGGWAEGMHPLDRFVKNTYEILSPLNELTAQLPMRDYQFLTADRLVRRSAFGQGPAAVEVTVNGGREDYRLRSRSGGEVVLPPYGFLVESPTFIAFCALQWNGLKYDEPAMFALRSRDGRPIGQSAQVRIYHGFGQAQIQLGKAKLTVPKESIDSPGM